MATITRGATVLTPTLILGLSLRRESRTVVHSILGTDETEETVRDAGPRSGEMRTFWPSYSAASVAQANLATGGAAWLWTEPGVLSMRARVTGDVALEATDDAGSRWTVTVGVTEVEA